MAGELKNVEELHSPRKGGGFLERLAEKLGGCANSKVVYGDPVEKGDVTVIPVAKAAWGFGGGSRSKDGVEDTGGGGGLRVTPVGYIELKSGVSEFKPIRDPAKVLAVVAGAGLTGMLLLRGLRRLFRS